MKAEVSAPASVPAATEEPSAYRAFWLLIGAGWLSTNLGYSIADLPMRFTIKETMHRGPEAVAFFFAVTQFTNYIKPLAAVFTDYIPLFGTRRRHYLLLSLAACGLMWMVLGLAPRTFLWWVGLYAFLHCFVVFISTTLGGIMVEGGARFRATGRLSAQRIGIFRIVSLVGGPLGGWLATRDFLYTAAITAAFHFLLLPVFARGYREGRSARMDREGIENIRRQAMGLVRSRGLWAAAGLVFLIMAAPGHNTALLFYQTDTLKFDKTFIGSLGFVGGACGVAGAWIFSRICRRFQLRMLLVGTVVIHIFAELLYLGYGSPVSAVVITGLFQLAQTLALLPLYDLAMRATPRGSEALGYSVMMSVWNVTNALSDILGSFLYGRHLVSFRELILVNAGTTALVLFALAILPRSLTDRREGEVTFAV